MKLINDFFHILDAERHDDALLCKVSLNPDHDIYRVHFPGNPVTPGVCLLQMATEILEHHYGRRLRLDTALNIRFKNRITPDLLPTFDFNKVHFEASEAKARLTIRDAETHFVTMSLKYKDLGFV